MRIVHVASWFMPWLGYQEYYLARMQLRQGHDVTVVSSNLRWPGGYYRALREPGESSVLPTGNAVELGIPTIRLPVLLHLFGRPVMKGVGRTLRDLRPDVVHAHTCLMPSTFQAALAKRKVGFRLVVDEHQLPHQAVPGRAHAVLRRTMAVVARRFLYPRIDSMVAIADGTREWLLREYRFPADRTYTIYLGADAELFSPDASAGLALRKALGIGEHERVVVSSGKVAAHKRIDLLVRAVAGLPPALSATLVLVGPAEAEILEQLTSLTQRLGVRLISRPAVSTQELARFFNAADVCAWPSDCSISHLEAAACGKPIVIPAEPSIADRLSGGNGIGVAVGDVRALTSALESLLADRDLAGRMGLAGRQLIQARYSWEAVAAQFERLYLGKDTPGPA
jgi:glycosyltransferase involved in cell wall biosynthesis